MVSATSARPSGGRPDVPAKMTSSILPPRRDLAPCSPITQASASTTLDLPEPLGPTMQVMPGSSCRVVDDAKDLNPFRVRLFRYNAGLHRWSQCLRGLLASALTRAQAGCVAGEAQRDHPTCPAPRFCGAPALRAGSCSVLEDRPGDVGGRGVEVDGGVVAGDHVDLGAVEVLLASLDGDDARHRGARGDQDDVVVERAAGDDGE